VKPVTVSVLIPAYNESKIIGRSLDKLCSFFDGSSLEYEIVVCDDCSKDGTPDVAKAVGSSTGKVNVLRFTRRIGKGGTIRNAVQVARGEVLLILDADLPVSLGENVLHAVASAKDKGGLVVGVRRMLTGGSYGAARRLLSVGYNTLVKLLFRTGVRDHQTGLKAMRVEVARRVVEEVRSDGFLFDTSLIVNARRLGVPVEAVNVEWQDQRSKGESKIVPARTVLTMFMDLLALRLSLAFGKRLLRLKTVKNGGVFVDGNSGRSYPIVQRRFNVKRERVMNFLRKVYFMAAFGRS